jgi:hypothetical protein
MESGLRERERKGTGAAEQSSRKGYEGSREMNASIKGMLRHFQKAWRCIEYDGYPLSKDQAKDVLEYADSKGYQELSEVTDGDVEYVLEKMKGGQNG